MEDYIYLFDMVGLSQFEREWFDKLPSDRITDTYEGILGGYYAIASEEQIEFMKKHEDYDLYHLFYMIEYTDEEVKVQIAAQNEEIRKVRLNAYKNLSDPLYIEYQKELALGNVEKAETVKTEWLAKTKEIEEEHPYITE